MIINIILLAIIIISLGVVAYFIIKKFPVIAAIDLKNLPHHRQSAVKDRLIEQRLKRKFDTMTAKTETFLEPYWVRLRDNFRRWYKIFVEMEKNYQNRSHILLKSKPELMEQIKLLLTEAELLFTKGELSESEKKYIEVIGLDMKNLKAYQGLGEIYYQQKDYEHAREALEYILKIGREDDSVYFDLGLVHQAVGDIKKALASFKKAVRLQPNSPKNLDKLLEIYIIMGDKLFARETFQKLAKVNPENQKLEELKEQIGKLE